MIFHRIGKEPTPDSQPAKFWCHKLTHTVKNHHQNTGVTSVMGWGNEDGGLEGAAEEVELVEEQVLGHLGLRGHVSHAAQRQNFVRTPGGEQRR